MEENPQKCLYGVHPVFEAVNSGRKIEKVLFLAREGDLYQKVFHAMYPDIPTEYVLWSRIGVVKTIVEKNRHPYLLQIVHHKANALYKSKIGTLLYRTGIGDLKKYLPDYRIKGEEFLTPKNKKIPKDLKKILEEEEVTLNGRMVSEEEKEQMLRVLEALYRDAKEKNKRK